MTVPPGRAWFDRFQDAFCRADLDAIWAMQTSASHALTLARLAETIAQARRDPNVEKALRDRMGPDVRDLTPKEVWTAYTQASCEHAAKGHMVWEYVGEESDGDRVVVRLKPGGNRPLPAGMDGELVQVLVQEKDGEWRLDKPLSEELAAS